jgi:hypothetical protein
MNNQTTAPQWRQATADDLGAVDAIGNGIHLSLPERPEVFAEKLDLFPPPGLPRSYSLRRNSWLRNVSSVAPEQDSST